jgi:prephenate dehydrogenase
MPAPAIRKLVVIGVGLIGGSFALALKAAAMVGTVVGIGRGRSNLEAAQRRRIADRIFALDDPWTTELAQADLVLVATPVAQMPELFATIAPHLGPSSVVTDAGSTKQDIVAAARAHLGTALARFVPGHPIAGTEHSGAAAALATLFQGKNVVLTPLAETDRPVVDLVADCWRGCGAVVRMLDAARHDAIFAAVSHLPHALAFALVAELAARPDADEYFRYAASGFRDFTRLASSHPEMWRDICFANRDALRGELAAFRTELDRIDSLLAAGDRAGLAAAFERARGARKAWLARHGDGEA